LDAEASAFGVLPPTGPNPMTSSTTKTAPVNGANRGDFIPLSFCLNL
jgi:hypothetical protein